jgi:heat shock protein HtpX
MTIYTHADKNIRKTWILITLFLILIIALGYIFGRVFENPGILFFAIVFSILMSFGSYWWSDKLVLLISQAREINHESNKNLYRLVENLCITAGLPVPKIYVIEDDAMNAFTTGRDPKHAVIAMTTGLVKKLNKLELEGVIAHELSHIGNRDMLLSTVLVVLVGFVTLLADWFWRFGFFGFGGFGGRRRDRREGGGQFEMIMLLIAIALSVIAPLVATLIHLAISRSRESIADASGALLTRYPEGLASALEKISVDPSPLRVANKATAHLYISNPLTKKEYGFLAKLFSTHPPIEERIKALRGMEK